MDHNSEGTLKLLQDIKELLLGIALLLLGGIFVGLGVGLAGLTRSNGFFLLLGAGLIIMLYGGGHIWYGWVAHHVEETDDETESMNR